NSGGQNQRQQQHQQRQAKLQYIFPAYPPAVYGQGHKTAAGEKAGKVQPSPPPQGFQCRRYRPVRACHHYPCRRQRVPSAESSKTIPASPSCVRMASARAKFFSLFAAMRSATSASTSSLLMAFSVGVCKKASGVSCKIPSTSPMVFSV